MSTLGSLLEVKMEPKSDNKTMFFPDRAWAQGSLCPPSGLSGAGLVASAGGFRWLMFFDTIYGIWDEFGVGVGRPA